MIIDINQLKARANSLIDERMKIEGRIAEVQHLIAWMEKETNSPVALEVAGESPMEAV